MGLSDPVVFGSLLAVALSVVVICFVVFKVIQMMNRDEQNR